MAAEIKQEIALEIAHVLFIDIVAYSKMASDDQRAAIDELNRIVQSTDEFRKAESENRLLKIATGDGMALVFYHSPEDPVECALEISRALKEHPNLRVRMGVHTGPVSGVVDVTGRANVAGTGINTAQRVMDCGDAGHILLSKRVAEDLEQFKHWRPLLYHLGTCEVKHGGRVEVVNVYSDELGNAQLPKKFQALEKRRAHLRWGAIAGALLFLAGIVAAIVLVSKKSTSSTSIILEKSIAVLPFENLSEEKANAFFADGVQDEILTHLAQIADLKVISRTSVMQYKTGPKRNLREIGQQLGVARLLEGSVQRAANKVRVNAQLIDARNDAHLWAQTYDRDLADVFAIQSEIAKAIADQLQAKLSPTEKSAIEQRPTADVAAFEQYSRAKSIILASIGGGGEVEKSLRQAIDLLQSAIVRDPAFHAAYCQLALANSRLYSYGYDHTPSRLAAAEAALRNAARLRPDSAETHLARASYLYYGFRDYTGALAELEVARRGLPNDPRIFELTGYILRRQGKREEGLLALEQAVTLDPRNIHILSQIADSYGDLHRYRQEVEVLDRALRITPDDVGLRAIRSYIDLVWRANPEPMRQLVERVRVERPASLRNVADNWFDYALVQRDWTAAEQALTALGDDPFWVDGNIILSRRFGEGLLARAMGDETRALGAFAAARIEQEQIAQEQKDYGPALCVLGLIDAALGKKEAALKEGRRALELLPADRDATDGQALIGYFALIAAWTGEKDLALQQLAAAVRLPGASFITSYGMLKLYPLWDPLRGDPRFEGIVASLAPKK